MNTTTTTTTTALRLRDLDTVGDRLNLVAAEASDGDGTGEAATA